MPTCGRLQSCLLRRRPKHNRQDTERPKTAHDRVSNQEGSMNIFVGNLNWETTEDELEGLFVPYGTVDRVQIITDRDTGRSRGFGFVEMPDSSEAQAAIEALNGT